MKKLVVLFGLVLCLFLSSVNIFAAEDNDQDLGTVISVTFKVGTANYTVNDKTVKAEASALVQGITYVPVNVISDALNATLKVDLKAKTAIINYNDVEIKLTEKKKEATIAGKIVKMDSAPYIKNSSFMVSISFLADSLGADLKNEKGQVSFTKQIVNPNSIKDFSSLIKKTNKSKIGDSYHKWSMLLPEDLKLYYRDFNGTKTQFESQDGSYFITLNIYDREEDQTLDDVANEFLEYLDEYTLIDYSIQTQNELEFVEFVYKDDEFTYQERVFLSSNKEYYILLITDNEDSYLDDKYQDILNSFEYKFKKDGSTEDLSDVNASGYRKYQDTRLKWSINLLPDWIEYKSDSVQNSVVFNDKDNSVLSVAVYSLDKGETLDSVTKDSIKEDSEELNADLYKVIKQESTVIGGVKCNKVYYSIELYDGTYYGWDIFFVDKNYKYIIGCEIPEKAYNNSKQRKLVEGMINSFKFSELNFKNIGKLLDPDKIVISNKPRKINNDLFSFEIPSNWKKDTSTEENIVYSLNSMEADISVLDSIPFNDFIKNLDDALAKMEGENFKLINKTMVPEKGINCYIYEATYVENDIEYREFTYVMDKNGKLIMVNLKVNDLFYGTKNKEILAKIWESFALK